MEKNMKYKTVLFDFDGTVMNSGPGIISCVKETAKKYNLPIPDESILRKFVGPPIRMSFENSFGVDEEKAQEMVECYRQIHKDKDAFMDGEIYGGMEELLQKLNDAGVACAIASVKRESTVRETLLHFDMLHYFKAVCGGDGTERLPDKAAVVRDCLHRLNVGKSGVILVGDSDYDAVGAEEVGIDFCAVLWGFGFDGMEDLTTYQCRYIAEDVPSLSKFLLG